MRIAGERSGKIIERSLSLLAVGAVLAFLWLARELLIPVTLGTFLAAAVSPVVLRLERLRARGVRAGAAGVRGPHPRRRHFTRAKMMADLLGE